MHSLDLIKMAIGNLVRRKTRTILTMLGVVIGTLSIVVMLSLGIAMNQGLEEQISSMGDLTVIEINSMGNRTTSGVEAPALDDDAVELLQQLPNVEAVMPIRTLRMRMVSGKYVANTSVIGIEPDVMKAFGFEVDEGRLLEETDDQVIVFGASVENNFYNPRDSNQSSQRSGRNFMVRGVPSGQGGSGGMNAMGSMPGGQQGQGGMNGPMGFDMGRQDEVNQPLVNMMTDDLFLTSNTRYSEERISLASIFDTSATKLYEMQTVGKLTSGSGSSDYNVYMNMTAFEKLLEENQSSSQVSMFQAQSDDENKYESISVKVNDYRNVEQVLAILELYGFQTFSLTEILSSLQESSEQTQAVLGGIGAISLLVAAIGITNTMIMSINERTREIGVMKVIGADLDDIKKMFLIEAGMIGFWGGAMGIAFSYLISYVLNNTNIEFLGYSNSGTAGMSIIPVELSIAAIIFATLIGLLSGYSPARRAMNISALDAIRTEK